MNCLHFCFKVYAHAEIYKITCFHSLSLRVIQIVQRSMWSQHGQKNSNTWRHGLSIFAVEIYTVARKRLEATITLILQIWQRSMDHVWQSRTKNCVQIIPCRLTWLKIAILHILLKLMMIHALMAIPILVITSKIRITITIPLVTLMTKVMTAMSFLAIVTQTDWRKLHRWLEESLTNQTEWNKIPITGSESLILVLKNDFFLEQLFTSTILYRYYRIDVHEIPEDILMIARMENPPDKSIQTYKLV